MPQPLGSDALYRTCSREALAFGTTDELPDLDEVVGQDRAMEALRLGMSVRQDGFNVFALGGDGADRRQVVMKFLQQRAQREAQPSDWCYVFNFDVPNQPRLLRLACGIGRKLREGLDNLVSELRTAIPSIFESEEYQRRVRSLEQGLRTRREEAIERIHAEAEAEDIGLIVAPNGFTFVPRHKGEALDPAHFNRLPEQEQQRIKSALARLEQHLRQVLEKFPLWQRELGEQVRRLNEEMILVAVGQLIEELKRSFAEVPTVLLHLDAVQTDLSRNVSALVAQPGDGGNLQQMLDRYRANLLVDHAGQRGAPVVFEDMPTVPRLLGRIEHTVFHGALVTDFSLIRPGCLHRANGGYLVLDLRKLLQMPFAWEALKRALFAHEARTDSLEQIVSMISTVGLEPEPMALDLKVVLLGDRLLYYLLSAYDPEFTQLFKIQADFAEELPRKVSSEQAYARLIATLARRRQLRPLDRAAVARAVEQASRWTADSERLSAHVDALSDLLAEADHWAAENGAATITDAHVESAVERRIFRASRVQEEMDDAILRGIHLISTEGVEVGQVNGLVVIELGDYLFGRPSRISATARLGGRGVIDIERAVKLGGAVHSKAVLILSHFLGTRYLPERNLALTASIAFEQSYRPVEGDSASVAEACALLSAIAAVPLSQALAVTGSLNQHGEVQAVGGINEKIEGFFDVCRKRGFAPGQGVLIPAANIPHLMLRKDVRDAVDAGSFLIYPLEDIDQALELLSGLSAGKPDPAGRYPDASFNRRVQERLERFASLYVKERGDKPQSDDARQ